MAKTCFMGIDVGTTGAKVILFDSEGYPQTSAYKEYPCNYIKPGWVEQDAQLLAETVRQLIVRVSADAVEKGLFIASIAASAQRNSLIFVDSSGAPLKMIGWQDARATEEVKDIERITDAQTFYKTCGLPLGPMWLLPKIMWVRKNEPELWSKCARAVQLNDFILRSLGADDYYMDDCCGNYYCFWDIEKACYDQTLMREYGMDASMLPINMAPGTRIGSISKDVAKRTGLREGTPLCVGVGDQNAATIGAGVVEDGCLSVSLGTGGIAIAYMDKLVRDPACKIMIANHAIPGKWEFEGLQNASAGVFRWFRDEISALEKYMAEQNGGNYYDGINKVVEGVPAGANGLILLPYFSGSAVPQWDNNARGVLFGLSFSHDRACMARAFMEGVVMEQKKIINHFTENGISVSDIRIIGGATNSDVWNQIQADMYGQPVKLPLVKDAAALGAAVCAAVGYGAYCGIKEGVAGMVKIKKTYEPIPENVRVYNENFSIYMDVYNSLTAYGAFDRIVEKQS